ncbi:MAG: long-chain fatty acid--CoA ligase, partial [Actinomycetes bacterium]
SGDWQSWTWEQTGLDCTQLAAGLLSLGLEPEDRVGLVSSTRVEWIFSALAVALAGGAVTTVYPSTGAKDAVYILQDSDTKLLIAEDAEQLAKIEKNRDQLPDLIKVIVIDGNGDGDFVITLDDLRDLGREFLAEHPQAVAERAASVRPEQLATLIYTSGTTGMPKGVELLHSNWGYLGATVQAVGVITPDDLQFLWLPLAHVFGSALVVTQLQIGFTSAVDGRIPKIVENLEVIRPTIVAAVPRIFEKVYSGVTAKAKAEGGIKARLFDWAMGVGTSYRRAELANGKAPGGLSGLQFAVADKLVLSKVRDKLGGRVRYFVSGSAALAPEVAEFFYIIGVPILEGYGLTETTAASVITRPDRIKFGMIGEAMPGTEIMIAADGEILIRGGGVMRGYHNRPDANAEAFEHGDGWFSSGDIGAIDPQGRVQITDRKKALVKTSGGKYIAPSNIEAQFKAICPLAGNMVVHANNRNFASALVTLDPDAAAAWGKAHNKATDVATLSADPDMIAAIQASVDALNAKLNRWETIKKFVILDHDLTIDDGELTPSLKVKRKVVEDRYRDLLDALYT